MGRWRLRRGCSLEVIFEEDTAAGSGGSVGGDGGQIDQWPCSRLAESGPLSDDCQRPRARSVDISRLDDDIE